MKFRKYQFVLLMAALALFHGTAYAQGVTEDEPGWTGFSFTGGLSSGSSDTGVALGGTFTYELTPRFALEAKGQYLDRGSGADAFDLAGSLLVILVPSTRDWVPYLAAGGGLYRASYDIGDRRFLGPFASRFGPGIVICTGTGLGPAAGPGTGTCPFGELPSFYARRLGNVIVPTDGALGSRTFTDPALNFGGGVRIDLAPHVFVRPDARALVILAEGDTYTLGVFTVSFGYRF